MHDRDYLTRVTFKNSDILEENLVHVFKFQFFRLIRKCNNNVVREQ